MSVQDQNSQGKESNTSDAPADTSKPTTDIKENDMAETGKPDRKTSFITEINFSYLLIGFLVIISFIQIRQIDSLQQDIQWLAQQIHKTQNSDAPDQKFAIMSFEDTFQAWNEVDPTGQTVSKILDTTIKSYNNKGITILDSSAVIGGKGNLEFIDVTPDRYMKEQNSVEK